MVPANKSVLAIFTGVFMVIVPAIRAIDPSMIHARALATSSSTECPAEIQACATDEDCLACVEEFADGCFDALSSATDATCDDLDDALCCQIAPGDDCESNSALEALFGCLYEDFCTVDFGTCTSTADEATTSSDDGGNTFIGGGNDDASEDEDDITNTDASSASPSAVFTVTTGGALVLAVAAAFHL